MSEKSKKMEPCCGNCEWDNFGRCFIPEVIDSGRNCKYYHEFINQSELWYAQTIKKEILETGGLFKADYVGDLIDQVANHTQRDDTAGSIYQKLMKERLAELTELVEDFIFWCENRTEACAFEDDEIALSRVIDEACALLRGEEGKMNMEADMSMQSTCSENVSKNGEVLKVPNSTGLNPSKSRGLKSNSATPQFTADEIEAIRKIAQFMGVTVADSIIAKCDAMLKGAQG